MEFDAAFLEECEEISFINVGGSLRAKVPSCHIPQPNQCKNAFKNWQ